MAWYRQSQLHADAKLRSLYGNAKKHCVLCKAIEGLRLHKPTKRNEKKIKYKSKRPVKTKICDNIKETTALAMHDATAASEALNREMGFFLYRKNNKIIFKPREICIGDSCALDYKFDPKDTIGSFHTHPVKIEPLPKGISGLDISMGDLAYSIRKQHNMFCLGSGKRVQCIDGLNSKKVWKQFSPRFKLYLKNINLMENQHPKYIRNIGNKLNKMLFLKVPLEEREKWHNFIEKSTIILNTNKDKNVNRCEIHKPKKFKLNYRFKEISGD